MIVGSLEVPVTDFTSATGWEARPEGMCRGEVCVPAPEALLDGGRVDLSIAAQRLGMPVVHDEVHGLWALGPATVGGRALDTAVAATPTLVDRRGNDFDFASLHGRKVILVAWASW